MISIRLQAYLSTPLSQKLVSKHPNDPILTTSSCATFDEDPACLAHLLVKVSGCSFYPASFSFMASTSHTSFLLWVIRDLFLS